MRKLMCAGLVVFVLVLSVPSLSFAAFWLQPTDLTMESVQHLVSNTYITVSWDSGGETRFYQVSNALTSTEKNRILATALTIMTNGGTDFRLHINNSAQVDGIDIK